MHTFRSIAAKMHGVPELLEPLGLAALVRAAVGGAEREPARSGRGRSILHSLTHSHWKGALSILRNTIEIQLQTVRSPLYQRLLLRPNTYLIFCSVFRDLQDLNIVAPLESRNFSKISSKNC